MYRCAVWRDSSRFGTQLVWIQAEDFLISGLAKLVYLERHLGPTAVEGESLDSRKAVEKPSVKL